LANGEWKHGAHHHPYNQWLFFIAISGIGSLPLQVREGNKAPYICPGGSTASNVQTNAPVSYQVIGPYACQQAAFLVGSQHVQNGATIPVGSPPVRAGC